MEIPVNEEKKVARVVEGGSGIEALGGIAAVVLAILGLVHVGSGYMLAIAAIVLGGSMLFQGGMVAAEYGQILSEVEGNPHGEFGGGLGAEALAGVAAIVLGILALLNVAAPILMAVAAIVLGVGLVLSSGLLMRLNSVKIDVAAGSPSAKHAAHAAVSTASATQVLVGVAAAVLGILALIGINPLTLTLVAMLGLGVSLLLSGASMLGRMFTLFHR